MGGYEANFNPPLEDKYKCPVCLAALRDPVQTKCGHRLCSSCFKTIRGGNWYFRCPVDNTWSNNVFEDNAVKREVLSLKVDCFNSNCAWTGELREQQTHLKNCQFEKIECPNKCKTDVMRLDLDKHLLECPLRLEKCEHCKIEVVVTQLARHHLLMCPKFPVNCPVCGETEVMRENINGHINIISGDCPMVVVPCSFRHIGCMHQDQRCKMSKHYQEMNTQHLMMLSTRLVDLETKHRLDLECCAKKFDLLLSDLKQRIDISEKRNTHLENELKEYKLKLGLN
ncbi:TNF receptor-associated factor 6 [Brachionus plicatilis]|uniref:TNF receptor-associated factor 6 n=1 Tax=Brachionus plicatilis TaxID=10195 RepID=A0A3M7R7Q0_BRAPC|nr:TNF receptor-associated factor 6 [Brachionus plicatilis]